MGVLAVLLLGLVGWLVWTGRLQRMTMKDGMALGIALVGAVMSAKGKPLIGAPMLITVLLFFLARTRKAKPAPKIPPKVPSRRDDDIAHARALLGLSAQADADEIRAAHRRLIASVHPDRGGTEALAAQINAARDLLLADRNGKG